MDILKFKLPLMRAASAKRFQILDFFSDICDPKKTGSQPSDIDFELCHPKLGRRENIHFQLSNCLDNSSLLINLKWRPDDEASSNLVTLVTDISLTRDGINYTYENVETYRVSGDENSYGSSGSAFKFIIMSPYRRSRLLFRGYMKIAGTNEEKLIKFNLTTCPTSLMFDYNHNYNLEGFKQSYRKNGLTKPVGNVARELLFHDKHEHMIRLTGDIILDGKTTITLWGFFSKTFVETKNINSKEIRALMTNGQALHLIQRKLADDCLDLGYTCFKITPLCDPIEKLPEIDWSKISDGVDKFSLEVSGSEMELKFSAERRDPSNSIYNAELDGVKGWACVTLDEDLESEATKKAVLESLQDYKDRISKGLVHVPSSYAELVGDKKPLVVGISDPQCASTELVGAKSASLAQLTRFSKLSPEPYEVTGGVVLTRFAYDAFLDQNSHLIEQITKLDEHLANDELAEAEIRKHCQELIESFKKGDIPPQVSESLEKVLSETFPNFNDRSFAVRSSSWGEDGEEMSAAGQLTTELNVKGFDSILEKVKVCFGSKFSYENAQYKKNHGLSPSLPMAVAIQEMVSCDKAGVLFTTDLIDSRQMIITANYGLGESVVSAQAEPDQIKVRFSEARDSEPSIADISVGSKSVIITNGEQNHYDRSKCCLTDSEIIRLAKASRAIAQFFGAPRDIEWGFKAEDNNEQSKLFMFQSRPITSLDLPTATEILHECDRLSRAENEFATRANVGEVMPYAMTPLTSSYLVQPWSVFGCRLCIKYSGQAAELHPDVPFDFYVGSYHAYFGLRRSQLFPMVPPGMEKPILLRSMEISMFGHELPEIPGIVEASRNLPPAVLRYTGPMFEIKTLDISMAPSRVVLSAKPRLKWAREQLEQGKPIFGPQIEDKLKYYHGNMMKLQKVGIDCWQNHLNVVFLNNMSNFKLQSFLSMFIKDPVELFSSMNKFLSAPDVLSGEIPKRVSRIAELIRLRGPEEVEKFCALPSKEALDYLQTSDAPISEEYNKFIDKFGHRCYNEFELSQKSWRHDQETIVEMIKMNCKTSGSQESTNKKLGSNDEILKSLNLNLTWKQRLVILHLTRRCQSFVVAREQSKDALIDFCDILRENVTRFAKELKRNLRIPDEELIFYFLYSELEPLVEGPQPALVSRALYRRTVLSKMFEKKWNFEEIISGHDLAPIGDKELDEAERSAPKLFGNPASYGRAKGRACIVNGIGELHKVQQGDILVTHNTDIGFSPVFPMISGLVTEMGGMISHGAVVARECGLPCLLGITDATKILDHGEEVLLDADKGQLVRLSKQQASEEKLASNGGESVAAANQEPVGAGAN